MSDLWVGVDTGGTFTDVVLVDRGTGEYAYHKLPTSAVEPAEAILEGIRSIIADASAETAGVEVLVHGTTLGTNALLQGRYAKTGMITTRGFGDILDLARQRRPHFFKLDVPKPTPIVSNDLRLEVTERIDFDGNVSTPLDEAEVAAAVEVLRAAGAEAVAICFLHAYANPEHERRAKEILHQIWPEIYCCTSAEVLAEFREFERFATTTINTSLMPVMDRYLQMFENGVRELDIPVEPKVLQSNGGAVSCAAIRKMPVNTFFSGPAGGVIGSMGLAAPLGLDNLITFDMGGTSTDVCLIVDGEPAKKNIREMAGFPVRVRTIDLHSIGAGGGSIAWVDPGGLLKVGPESAGAIPGPASYGRGGEVATVTDANVVLGRLGGRNRLAGKVPLRIDLAEAAIGDLTESLVMDTAGVAAGIIEIVNANMIGAVRVISIEQGHDPRDFILVAFGGAGPLHGAEIAAALGMEKVLIFPRPGLLSAVGLLHADLRADFSLTRLVLANADSVAAVNDAVSILRARGEAWLREEQTDPGAPELTWSIDMRYVGQSFELLLPLTTETIDADTIAGLCEQFHEAHRDAYGYFLDDQPIEIVNLRLVLGADHPSPAPDIAMPDGGSVADALVERRPVWFAATGFTETAVYDRTRLPLGAAIEGPSIIEQMDSTTVVPPGNGCMIDGRGNILITLPRNQSWRSHAKPG